MHAARREFLTALLASLSDVDNLTAEMKDLSVLSNSGSGRLRRNLDTKSRAVSIDKMFIPAILLI